NCAPNVPSRGSSARKYRAQYTRTAAPTPKTIRLKNALKVSSRKESCTPSWGIHSHVCTSAESRLSAAEPDASNSSDARILGNCVDTQIKPAVGTEARKREPGRHDMCIIR